MVREAGRMRLEADGMTTKHEQSQAKPGVLDLTSKPFEICRADERASMVIGGMSHSGKANVKGCP